jgi:hypothetical protein
VYSLVCAHTSASPDKACRAAGDEAAAAALLDFCMLVDMLPLVSHCCRMVNNIKKNDLETGDFTGGWPLMLTVQVKVQVDALFLTVRQQV